MAEIIAHPSSMTHRRGIALLAVLFIIMAITVLSLGFLARSSTELECGQNVAMHVQTDQLAASGLEHARGLILNPQEVTGQQLDPNGYWLGTSGLRLSTSAEDCNYYNVAVGMPDANDRCTYSITCDAYQQAKDGRKKGESKLSAQLRLDPAIALWTGAATTLTSGLTIHGDVRCGGNLVNYGAIDGDVFAAAMAGTGTETGHQSSLAQLSLAWPGVTVGGFTSHWTTDTLSSGMLSGVTYGPYSSPHILSRSGNLAVGDNVTIQRMLLVEGNLTIQGNNNTIVAPKNLPAVYVTEDLVIGDVTNLNIQGLVLVAGNLYLGAGATNINVQGALFVGNSIIETTADSSSNGVCGRVHGAPTWSPSGGQIGGAMQFDGTDDYIQTPDSPSALWVLSYTFSLWINANPGQMASATIFRKCSADEATSCWALQFDSSGQQIVVWHYWFGSPQSWPTGITAAQVAGGWHHVCITYDWMTGSIASYLDGNACTGGGSLSWPGWGAGHLNIGTSQAGSSQYMYKGLLDDVRIYSWPATSDDAQILALKKTGKLSSNLTYPVGYWAFDEGGARMTVLADPAKAAIVAWSGSTRTHWTPAAGAFFKRIERMTP